jgi:hypothetical protein
MQTRLYFIRTQNIRTHTAQKRQEWFFTVNKKDRKPLERNALAQTIAPP